MLRHVPQYDCDLNWHPSINLPRNYSNTYSHRVYVSYNPDRPCHFRGHHKTNHNRNHRHRHHHHYGDNPRRRHRHHLLPRCQYGPVVDDDDDRPHRYDDEKALMLWRQHPRPMSHPDKYP